MDSSKRLSVREFLRSIFGLQTEPHGKDTRLDTTPLEGKLRQSATNSPFPLAGRIEPLGDTNKYYLGVSIPRGVGEKGAYYIATQDIISFVDTIYPSYVAGNNGKHIQVLFQIDKASPSMTFSKLRELAEYAQELDGMVVCDPIVSISYSGSNKDVPKQILIERAFISSLVTDYAVFVEAARNYNLGMIDVCVGKLFNGRHKFHLPYK